MIADFYIGQGDLSPSIVEILEDENGNPVPQADSDGVRVRMRLVDKTRPAIEGPAFWQDPTGTDPTLLGVAQHDWQPGETDVPGLYELQWLTSTAGIPETYSNNKVTTVYVHPKV